MCGRYYRRSDKQRLGDAFNIGDLPSSLVISEDYNVAPTTFQPVIRNDKETGERELVLMRWGLVPFFTKQLSDGPGCRAAARADPGLGRGAALGAGRAAAAGRGLGHRRRRGRPRPGPSCAGRRSIATSGTCCTPTASPACRVSPPRWPITPVRVHGGQRLDPRGARPGSPLRSALPVSSLLSATRPASLTPAGRPPVLAPWTPSRSPGGVSPGWPAPASRSTRRCSARRSPSTASTWTSATVVILAARRPRRMTARGWSSWPRSVRGSAS